MHEIIRSGVMLSSLVKASKFNVAMQRPCISFSICLFLERKNVKIKHFKFTLFLNKIFTCRKSRVSQAPFPYYC